MKQYLLLLLGLTVATMSQGNESITELATRLDSIRQQNNVPAFSLVIVDKNNILYAAHHGNPSLNSDEKIPAAAYFRLGSITKSFIGLSAAIAEERELLTLSTPIKQIIGAEYFQNPWPQSPVTLEQLLEHTAGFPDMTSGAEFNFNEPVSDETGLKLYAQNRRVRWQPGLYSSYANTGFGLAGLTISKALNKPIEEWLNQSLWQPLGMHSATLKKTAQVDDNLVPGFNTDGVTPIPYWHMIFPSFAAMNVQPVDMAPFLQLLLNRGKHQGKPLVSEKTITRFETPVTPITAQAGITYGYGLGIYTWLRDGHTFYGHGGDADGYLARYAYQKDAGLGYFIVINAFKNSTLRTMQREIENWMIADLPAVTYPPEVALKNPQRFAGEYQAITQRFGRRQTGMTISVENGNLYSKLPGQRSYRLIPVAANQFRYAREPLATLTLIETENGMVFSGDDGSFIKLK